MTYLGYLGRKGQKKGTNSSRRAKAQKNMGPPSKYTPETLKMLLDAIMAGMNIKDSARVAGISDETVRNWQKKYPELTANMEKARVDCKLRNIAIIQKAAKNGNWLPAAWWLERTYPEEFSLKDRQPAPQASTSVHSQQNIFLLAKELGEEAEQVLYGIVARVARRRHPDGDGGGSQSPRLGV